MDYFFRGRRLQLHLENVFAVAAATALGAGDEHIAQELHFDPLKAGAPALLALALAGVEAECARVEASLLRVFGRSEEFANRLKRADVNRGIRARRAAQRRLIDQDDLPKRFET